MKNRRLSATSLSKRLREFESRHGINPFNSGIPADRLPTEALCSILLGRPISTAQSARLMRSSEPTRVALDAFAAGQPATAALASFRDACLRLLGLAALGPSRWQQGNDA